MTCGEIGWVLESRQKIKLVRPENFEDPLVRGVCFIDILSIKWVFINREIQQRLHWMLLYEETNNAGLFCCLPGMVGSSKKERAYQRVTSSMR